MQSSVSVSNITRSARGISKKVLKFHYIFSISLLVIGVSFTTYYINDILNNTTVSNSAASATGFSDKFDTETIKKINELKFSDEAAVLDNPGGRTNPFVE